MSARMGWFTKRTPGGTLKDLGLKKLGGAWGAIIPPVYSSTGWNCFPNGSKSPAESKENDDSRLSISSSTSLSLGFKRSRISFSWVFIPSTSTLMSRTSSLRVLMSPVVVLNYP